jgi:hypothetical protein
VLRRGGAGGPLREVGCRRPGRQAAQALRRLLPEGTRIEHLSRWEAAGLIQMHSPHAAWRREPPTSRQQEFLQARGLWREGLTRGAASDLITEALREERSGPGWRGA